MEINNMLRQAVAHFQRGLSAEAEICLHKILQIKPDHAESNHLLGIIACQHKQYEAGRQLITRAIQNNPLEPRYHLNLGIVLQMSGDQNNATAAYERAIQLHPEYAAAYNYLGNAYINLGNFQKALAASERAIELDPDLAEAYNNRGISLKALGRSSEAISAYETAIRLQPEYAEAYNNYGVALKDQGRLADALQACERAIQLEPGLADASNNLGTVLMDLHRLDESLAAFNRAVQLKPDYAEAHNNRGTALGILGRLVDAVAVFDQAIHTRPDYAEAHNNRGNTLRDLGKVDEAEASYRQALALKPDYVYAHSNLLFMLAANAQLTPEQMLREMQQWDRVHGKYGRAHKLPARSPGSLSGRRLRVGYVSPDLRTHAVSYFFEPLLASHDCTRFEIFCYDANILEQDDTTRRLQGISEHWRHIAGISDAELARLIHADHIDILVDLAGHTSGNRLRAFTYRPAPLQVTYLGFFASTGLEAMDYWITDSVLHPPNSPEMAVENIYRLPRCWVCYQPPAAAPDISPCPHTDDNVVFGSFSNLSKLTPGVIEAWSRLLHKLPNSRLLLMDKPLADRKVRQLLLERFEQHGVHANRLLIQKGAAMGEYLATYAMVDIVLDPFPRTGGTTTADALWMGLPVVTLAGHRYVERISTSKLIAAGLHDLVTDSADAYIEKAISLAKDPARRATLRSGLRKIMTDSPLRDSKGLAHDMETAYLGMWEKHVAGDRL